MDDIDTSFVLIADLLGSSTANDSVSAAEGSERRLCELFAANLVAVVRGYRHPQSTGL